MLSHLARKHKDVHERITAEWAKESEAESTASKRTKFTKKESLEKVNISGPELEIHCLRLITEHGLSFEVLGYKAFRSIIEPMLNAMRKRDRPTISPSVTPTKIAVLAARVRAKMASEMEGRMLSLQVDGAAKKHRHFIGVNVQYIKDRETKVRTLAIEELHVQSSAENLTNIVLQILRKFDVHPRNIVSVTSDNGGNYLLIGKLLHVQDPEVLQDLNDIGLEDDSWLDLELSSEEDPVQSVRCAAHTLQLAVDNAVKSIENLKPLIEAVRKLCNFLRTPNNVLQLKAAGKNLPLKDVATRWGSTYDMLKSVLSYRIFFQSVMDVSSKDRTECGLTDAQWEAVEGLVADLHPVYVATVKLQARDLTLGQLLAIWTEATMKLTTRKTALANAILTQMEERVKAVPYKDRSRGERLSPLFEYPAFFAAVLADPRYFSLLSREEVAKGKEYIVDLWCKLQARKGIQVEPIEEETLENTAEDDDDQDPFAAWMAKKNAEKIQASKPRGRSSRRGRASASTSTAAPRQGREKIKAMVDEYFSTTIPLPLKSDVLKFWEEKKVLWPELYDIAMIVLAIPATQVSVERLFSALRFILRPQRYNLSSERVDDIVFLHANPDLVCEVAKEMANEALNDDGDTDSSARS